MHKTLPWMACGLAVTALLTGCGSRAENPPQTGFDLQGSDPRALVVADRVMERLGGRENWDQTRYLSWRFFGRRRHVWDKWSGDVRIESATHLVLMNVHTRRGRAWQVDETGTAIADGEITDPQVLAATLEGGYAQWINDSYWLVMPYKLKDTGVTLRYVGPGTTAAGQAAEVISLTFTGVGRTPQNKYDVYVCEGDSLVCAWAFYADAGDAEPRFQVPWGNWQQFGNIWLSDDRGDRDLSDLAVFDHLPNSVFNSPGPMRF